MKTRLGQFNLLIFFLLSAAAFYNVGDARAQATGEWEKVLEAAKKEAKVVAGIPASAELRKTLGEAFKARFPAIDLELTNARGPSNAGKIAAEYAAGVRYFDLLISGTSTPFNLLNAGILEPVEPMLLLPEVKDPKRWFGGHMWLDNARRNVYMFQAYTSENFWYNTTLTKVDEARSYDDLLLPKWRGKVGMLDPRSGGGGAATWAFLLRLKGEEFLRKLAAQDMLLSRNQRQLGDSLAKGKVAMTIGLTYYSLSPFLKAGLPIKPLPEMKEGTYISCGSGGLSVVKNSPHPNATKVLVNWILSREGQEVYGKAMGQATRRLDVNTKWLLEYGTRSAKDFFTLEEVQRRENYSEETVGVYWTKGRQVANEVFK